MSLKEFEASGDDLDELKEASRKARTALVTGKTLEIKFTAATITISAGYVHKIKASLIHSQHVWTQPGACFTNISYEWLGQKT